MNQKTSIRTFFHSKGFVEFLHIVLEDKWLYVIIIGIRIIEVLLSLGWAELLSKNCTKIVIAHRLATVKDADYIAFVDKGKVVEYGTLEELVNLRSRFYEYWNKQINIDVR